MNLTAETFEAALRPNTKAVIVVHFGGLLAAIEPILEVAQRAGVAVVEDAAHAYPATRLGRAAGSFGAAGALSFYATKTVTTGEGGMLVTDSDRIAARARVMRLHGITGDVWKRHTSAGSWYYEIEDVGFKYNMTDVAAAMGLVQLRRAEAMRLERQRVADRYTARLGELLGSEIELPQLPDATTVHAWHLYPIRIRDGGLQRRAAVIDALRRVEIGTSVHFIPLHLHPYYRRTYGYEPGDFPIAENQYEREISLPIYPDLTDREIDRVVEALQEALRSVPVGA